LIIWWLESGMPYSPEYMADMFQKLTMPGVFAALGLPMLDLKEAQERLRKNEK
jgi:hypothetical protein